MVIARSSNLLGKITILVMVVLCVNTAMALDGAGTEGDPWLIKSLDDFNDFAADANYWDDYTRLETDVNLAGRTYYKAVIAPSTDNSFTGVFDGNGHKVINLAIDDSGVGIDFLGLFGYINYGEVRNLGLEGGSVSGDAAIGSLVGYIENGSVSNCYSTGDVSGNGYVGGLVGGNGGSVLNCYSTGDVSGTGGWWIGGLVGGNGGSVLNCYSTSSISGAIYVGGLVGENSGSVSNCFSTDSVSGDNWVGGLVGYNNDGSVSNCFSTDSVSGTMATGGLVGINSYDGRISNSYFTSDVNGYWDVGGLVGTNRGGSVSNSYSAGDVTGYGNVGGLGGHNDGNISNCYSTGSISGTQDIGGLVGRNPYGSVSNCYSTSDVNGVEGVGGLVGTSSRGTITNCYSVGSVGGNDYVGGLVGKNGSYYEPDCYPGSIISSYWDPQTSGEPNMCGYQSDCSSGCDPNYGKTTTEMMQQSTFTDWDFINVWNIGENQTYPYLRIYLAADLNKDGIVNFLDIAITANQWMEGVE